MTATTTPALREDPDRLLTIDELGVLLGGIAPSTLRAWARQGTGPRRLRIGGKHIRYRTSDVRNWLDTECAA